MWPFGRRSIKIAKGTKLKLSKSGTRVSKRVAKGVTVSTGKSGTSLNVNGKSLSSKKKKKTSATSAAITFWRLFK